MYPDNPQNQQSVPVSLPSVAPAGQPQMPQAPPQVAPMVPPQAAPMPPQAPMAPVAPIPTQTPTAPAPQGGQSGGGDTASHYVTQAKRAVEQYGKDPYKLSMALGQLKSAYISEQYHITTNQVEG